MRGVVRRITYCCLVHLPARVDGHGVCSLGDTEDILTQASPKIIVW